MVGFELADLRKAIADENIIWQKHVLVRLAERHILQNEALDVILTGEVIRRYDDDKPFPSVLMMGWVAERPLHVIAAYGEAETTVFIITVYEPSLDFFELDYKTKRK